MSDLSLLTGVYANVEAYANLIDRVIDSLTYPDSSGNCDERERLAILLIDASDQGRTKTSLEALVFDTLLRSDDGEQNVNLKDLGQRLLTGSDDKTSRRQLEALANHLEKERAEVAARLRGR